MLAAKTRQDGARRRPGGDKKREKIGFGSQDGSESDSGLILDGFLMVSGSFLDEFLVVLKLIFDGFSVEVRTVF